MNVPVNLKRVVKQSLASKLGWRICGPLLRAPGVIVLMYHRIVGDDRCFGGLPVEVFEAEMQWLRRHCDPIALHDFIGRSHAPRSGRPPVLVTFDDGYRDYFELAFPVLRRLGIPAVVFLTTAPVDHGTMLWTDELLWSLLRTSRDTVRVPWDDAAPTRLGTPDQRHELAARLKARLKRLPDSDRRAVLRSLLDSLGEVPAPERQMLSWDEVRTTLELTEYGGHTHTHPILSKLDDQAAEDEIRMCRRRIFEETGKAPTCFAYPNGGPEDYTSETCRIVAEAGYSLAFCTSRGIAGKGSDPYAIRRLPGDAGNVADFVWMMTGLSRA